MINTQRFILDIKRPTIPRLRLVNGDTANVFVITVQDDGAAVTLDADLHKVIAVFTRADGQVYTQDANTGLSFTTGGVVTINVRPASFRTGTNKVCLQIYKRESVSATTYPLLCTTTEAQFPARSQAIPDSGAPNAPSQLPMLEQLISDANTAITGANNAAGAANDAADAANLAAAAANAAAAACPLVLHVTSVVWDDRELSSIEFEETAAEIYTAIGNNRGIEFSVETSHEEHGVMIYQQHYVRQQYHTITVTSPYRLESFLYSEDALGNYCSINIVVVGGDDEIGFEGEYGNNTLTFDDAPTAGSNNPVKSGGIKTAIDTAAEKNVYLVRFSSSSWINDVYQTYATDDASVLNDIKDDSVFVTQITDTNEQTFTLYEYYRHRINGLYYLKSDVVGGKYITAELDISGGVGAQLEFHLHNDESPLVLHVDSTEEYTSDGNTYRRINFASGDADLIYKYRNTRDMYFELPIWNAVGIQTKTVCMRKEAVTSASGTEIVEFVCVSPYYSGAMQTATAVTLTGYRVSVFYVNGSFYNANGTYFTKTL